MVLVTELRVKDSRFLEIAVITLHDTAVGRDPETQSGLGERGSVAFDALAVLVYEFLQAHPQILILHRLHLKLHPIATQLHRFPLLLALLLALFHLEVSCFSQWSSARNPSCREVRNERALICLIRIGAMQKIDFSSVHSNRHIILEILRTHTSLLSSQSQLLRSS